jgi:hypothetical protein
MSNPYFGKNIYVLTTFFFHFSAPGIWAHMSTQINNHITWLQDEQDEHGHGKWEGKQKGKSDKRITESKARQKEALHCAQT